jgi:hypothetical protein
MAAVKVTLSIDIFFSSSRIFSFGISCQKVLPILWLDSRQIPGPFGFLTLLLPDLFRPLPLEMLIGRPGGTFNQFFLKFS